MAKNKQRKRSWISSDSGQRFFNFAYSIGAAIVIWGALFKILHLPGGNMLLSIGMGTEVLMFILTAFDRPPKEYHWEEVFPQLDSKKTKDETDDDIDKVSLETLAENQEDVDNQEQATDESTVASGNIQGGTSGPVYISLQGATPQAGTSATPGVTAPVAEAQVAQSSSTIPTPANDIAGATSNYLDQLNGIAAEMGQLRESTQALNHVSEILLESYRTITENSENITRSSAGYVEQMGDLSRNIQGLNTIYEIQLKSISSQLDAIDRVNRGIKDIRDMYEKSSEQSALYVRETEKMARYMQQLNAVYEKMITAMTINMYNPMMGQAPAPEMPKASKSDTADNEA
ncbi:MAG: gliding motility protein GldL [Muribaculaceae bacterium]|nr:gliding motility protein GldL [Muribaculaceae bacterium]